MERLCKWGKLRQLFQGTEKDLPPPRREQENRIFRGKLWFDPQIWKCWNTSKTISTIAILWSVKAIFEKRAATMQVDTFMPQHFILYKLLLLSEAISKRSYQIPCQKSIEGRPPTTYHTKKGFPSSSGIFRVWCTNCQNLRELQYVCHPQDCKCDVPCLYALLMRPKQRDITPNLIAGEERARPGEDGIMQRCEKAREENARVWRVGELKPGKVKFTNLH